MYSHKSWQVLVQERVYEAEIEELIQWIKEGSVLPEDQVRRGNLRWLSAGKIPELHKYFLEQRAENQAEVSAETAGLQNDSQANSFVVSSKIKPAGHSAFSNSATGKNIEEQVDLPVCSVHPERPYNYVCEICETYFCKTCPNTFGSSVKLCLNCGGLCVTSSAFELSGSKVVGSINKPYPRLEMPAEENAKQSEPKLRASDFIESFRHPLRFPLSLTICAVFFAALIVGKAILAVGGTRLLILSAAVSVLSGVLLFSVMFKTIENSVQNKPEANFAARLKRFTFWEDFIHPFLLSIAVVIITFGLFIGISIGAGAYAWFTFADHLENVETEVLSSNNKINSTLNSAHPDEKLAVDAGNVREKVKVSLERQSDSFLGGNYLADTTQIEKVFKSFMRLSIYFQMPLFFAFILGFLLFPAVSLVSGSTRSFSKTLNLLQAFNAIKKCGFDYIKIIFLTMIFMAALAAVVYGVYAGFSGANLPLLGAIGSLIIGSFLFFYLWLVFSNILGAVLRRKEIALTA